MIGLLVKVVLGVVLFAGSLVGGLAVTGRLNHEGVANIPVLNALFPAPPPPAEGEGVGAEAGPDGAHAAPGAGGEHPAPAGEAAPAAHQGEQGKAADAAHAGDGKGDDPQGQEGPRKSKTGKSVVNPEPPPAADGHGGGGGHGEPAEGHGDTGKDAHGAKPAGGHDTKKPAAEGHGDEAHKPQQDFEHLEQSLAGDRKNKYAPGGFFTFEGMPSGFTPEQLNEAWQRVRDAQADLDRRRVALELREQELQDLADEVGRRQQDLARERTKIVELHRELDQRIEKFQDQVKLVRNDEVAALKRNAQTLASFEPSKTAELIQEQWKTERGQDEVLKTLEFMDKERVNEIVNVLPNPMIQELLKKRLRVSKEATPAAPGKK